TVGAELSLYINTRRYPMIPANRVANASMLRFEICYGKAYGALALGRPSKLVLRKAREKPLLYASDQKNIALKHNIFSAKRPSCAGFCASRFKPRRQALRFYKPHLTRQGTFATI